MSAVSPPPARPSPPPDLDPFRFGWRWVTVTRPDGTEEFDQVPLTPEDVLHPEEGDFIVQTPQHVVDWMYLNQVFRVQVADDPTAMVTSDCRVDWGVPGLKAHGPDVAVFLGVGRQTGWKTLEVADQGATPALVVEVVSTGDERIRQNDVTIKVEHYHRAGVPQYVVVDDLGDERERDLRLVGYLYEPGAYRRQEPDPRGRLWLDAVRLWLGIEGERVACYDPDTGREIGDYVALHRSLAEADARLAEADARLIEADARLAEADARAAEAEARNRELEAELRRLRGEG